MTSRVEIEVEKVTMVYLSFCFKNHHNQSHFQRFRIQTGKFKVLINNFSADSERQGDCLPGTSYILCIPIYTH
jgi:hypothetical protein